MIRPSGPMSCHLALTLLVLVPQWLEWITPEGRAEALVRQGLAAGEERLEDAVPHYRRALEIYGELGDLRGQAECEMFLATVAREQGKPDAAIDLYRAAIPRLKALDDAVGVWILLVFQAEAELEAGRCWDAILSVEQGLDEVRRVVANPEIQGLETLFSYSRQAYCPNASSWGAFSQVNPFIYRMALSALESVTLGLTADVYRLSGHLETALALSRRALDKKQGLSLVDQQGSIHRKMGRMHLALGRLNPAAEHLVQALAVTRKAAYWEDEIALLRELADLERRRGSPEKALERYEEILEVAELMDAIEILAETYRQMSESYLETGQRQEAREYRERAVETERAFMEVF